MSWLPPAIIASLLATLLMLGVTAFIYQQERQRCLGLWAWGWAAYALRMGAELVGFYYPGGHGPLEASQILALTNGVILAWGTYALVQRPAPRWLAWGGAAGVAWIILAGMFHWSFLLLSLPAFTFLAVVYLWTGRVLLRHEPIKGLGGSLAGWGFILWGLHKADYPFLRPLAWSAPWGFILASTLTMAVALGLLLAFFQKTKRELALSQKRYQTLFQKANDMVLVLAYTSHGQPVPLLEFNQMAHEKLGYSRPELEALALADIVPPRLRPRLPDLGSLLLQQGTATFESAALAKDGHELPVEVSAHLFQLEGRQVVLAICRDISERLEAQARINQLAEVVQKADEGIILLDGRGHITSWNRGAQKIYGYRAEEVMGRNLNLIMPEDYAQEAHSLLGDLHQGRTVENFETKRLTKDGRLIDVLLNLSPIQDENGTMAGVAAFVRDVSEQKQAQARLNELAAIVASSEDAILSADLTGHLTSWNQGAQRLFGYPAEEVVGQPLTILFPPDLLERDWPLVLRAQAGEGIIHHETERLARDGRRLPVAITLSPVRDAAGRVVGVSAIDRDLSERKRQERENELVWAQLRQAQKMEAIGTLAGGIAHDFNNILGAIIGYTEIALEDLPGDALSRQDLKQVLASAERARDLVKHILAFSRRGEQERRPLHLQPVIKEALRMLRATLPATIEIRHELPAGRATVLGDPTQIHQVLMNLCTNALHAMREQGGRLTVYLQERQIAPDDPLAQAGLAAGPYLSLTVSDTGQGMPPEVLERIFDPFFTTKALGEGTGLGLAVVHGIVKAHGGQVLAYSRPGQGSSFQVLLPALDREELAPAPAPAPLRGGHEHILLVDDEPALVEISQRQLKGLGYRVSVAHGSDQALRLLYQTPQDLDLVVTDLTMPGLTGLDLAREINGLCPGIPVILCTGYTESVSSQEIEELGLKALLLKPLTLASLAQAIRQALD